MAPKNLKGLLSPPGIFVISVKGSLRLCLQHIVIIVHDQAATTSLQRTMHYHAGYVSHYHRVEAPTNLYGHYKAP